MTHINYLTAAFAWAASLLLTLGWTMRGWVPRVHEADRYEALNMSRSLLIGAACFAAIALVTAVAQ